MFVNNTYAGGGREAQNRYTTYTENKTQFIRQGSGTSEWG